MLLLPCLFATLFRWFFARHAVFAVHAFAFSMRAHTLMMIFAAISAHIIDDDIYAGFHAANQLPPFIIFITMAQERQPRLLLLIFSLFQ